MKRGKAKIYEATPSKINFEVSGQKFTLIQTSGDAWLLLNRG
jgi:hypothetical protein